MTCGLQTNLRIFLYFFLGVLAHGTWWLDWREPINVPSIPSYLRLMFYSDNQGKESATLFETRVHRGVNWDILISTKLL